jgi:hypothetical protein
MTLSTKSCALLAVAAIFFCGAGHGLCGGQEPAVKAELPVLVTSCGQSPGPTTLKVVLQRLKLDYAIEPLATAENLKDKSPGGAPFKTLVIVMGASLKGMGAAGISIDDELARAAELIESARAQGIKIIGAHIEGMKRRAQGAAAGDTTDEQSIDAVAPNSDLLLIYKEGNSDGRFTAISQAKGIPMIEVEKTMDLIPALESLFAK